MSYEDAIRQERSQMSKSFAKLADFLLDSYVEAAFMTASELAQALNLDAATVVRFSQHLGYSYRRRIDRWCIHLLARGRRWLALGSSRRCIPARFAADRCFSFIIFSVLSWFFITGGWNFAQHYVSHTRRASLGDVGHIADSYLRLSYLSFH